MNKMDKSGNNCAGGHLAATYARKETYLPLRFFNTLLVMMLTAVCVMGQGSVPNNYSVTLSPGTLPDGTTVSGYPMTLSTDSDLFYTDSDNRIWFKAVDNPFTTPEGYGFAGWKYGNNTYQPGQSIQMTSSSITLTAQWEPIPPCAFLQLGKTGNSTVPGNTVMIDHTNLYVSISDDGSGVANGQFYTDSDNRIWFKAANNPFTAPGYEFDGWKYGETIYQPGQSILMPSSGYITLTAQWELIPPYALLQPGTAGNSPVEENTVIINNSNFYGSISDDGSGVANGQFYKDSDNRIWFKAANNPFTAPAGYRFAGWKYGNATYLPGQSIQMPSSGSITLTAQWVDKDAPHYLLSPTRYTLEGSGYTDIPCTLTEFANGIINNKETKSVFFYMNGGTLTDGKGHSISFLVDDRFHFGAAERKAQGNGHSSAGETFIMAIFINPNDYNQAVPGTYTGTFTYDSQWNPMNYTGDSGSMILTLVVPESPDKIDLEAHAATLNGVSRYWTTFYHGRSAYQLPAGAQAFYMKEDKSLYLVGTDGSVIPSDCAVIIMSDNASIRLTKLDSTTVTKPGNNKLEGKAAQTTVSSLGLNEGENVYVMNMSDGGELGFYEFSGTTIPANKAYFIAR